MFSFSLVCWRMVVIYSHNLLYAIWNSENENYRNINNIKSPTQCVCIIKTYNRNILQHILLFFCFQKTCCYSKVSSSYGLWFVCFQTINILTSFLLAVFFPQNTFTCKSFYYSCFIDTAYRFYLHWRWTINVNTTICINMLKSYEDNKKRYYK